VARAAAAAAKQRAVVVAARSHGMPEHLQMCFLPPSESAQDSAEFTMTGSGQQLVSWNLVEIVLK
jgi:hypothetical protein